MSYLLRADAIHRKWPPKGGWIYHENATGWTAPNPMVDNFETTVDRIVRHRTANAAYNLSTDRDAVGRDLMHQVAVRILSQCPEHAQSWIVPTTEEEKKNSEPSPSSSEAVQAVVLHARKTGAADKVFSRLRGITRGAATLGAWIGDGAMPVAEFIANHRSEICVACPMNRPAEGFLDKMTEAVAEAIRSQTIVKNALDLRTGQEDKLGMCDVCGCPLRLKVWVPLVTILSRTSAEEMASFPEHCWIAHED